MDDSVGADVFAQRFMMMFVLKGIPVSINLVDAIKSRDMKRLPALKFQDEENIDDPGEIETFLETKFSELPLRSYNALVNEIVFKGAGSESYHKLCQLVKNKDPSADDRLKGALRHELHTLNAFLQSDDMPGRYLGGDSMLIPDCILLPKLLHIRVLAKVFKDFDIPEEFVGIHRYLKAATGEGEQSEDINVIAFNKTCPSQETIVDALARGLKIPNPLHQKKKKP